MPDQAGLRMFLDAVEITLAAPLILDDGSSVVGLAPVQGGLMGLDLETGRPVRVPPMIVHVDGRPTLFTPPRVLQKRQRVVDT